jgi:hypothetical protein
VQVLNCSIESNRGSSDEHSDAIGSTFPLSMHRDQADIGPGELFPTQLVSSDPSLTSDSQIGPNLSYADEEDRADFDRYDRLWTIGAASLTGTETHW